MELERENLLNHLDETNLRLTIAEAQLSHLKELFAASHEYLASIAGREEIKVERDVQTVEVLSRQLQDIQSRLSYRLLQRVQGVISKALPPNSNRAKAWSRLGQIARQPKHSFASLISHAQVETDYHRWMVQQKPTLDDLQRQRAADFTFRPLMSFIVPVYNPPPHALRDTLEAVFAQSYHKWELCLVNGDSSNHRILRVLNEFSRRDARVRLRHLTSNLGISGNSNAALEMATGDFIVLLDHDDTIEPDLLYQVVEALNTHPETDFVYFDQDMVSADGKFYEWPLFKPAWSPELLLTSPYPAHAVIRRELATQVGGFDPAMDGTQDWDLFLRLAEHCSKVLHVPRVLYHWRQVPSSAASSIEAKPYAYARQLMAVEQHMRRRGLADVTAAFAEPDAIRVSWQPRGSLVSVIIPTHDNAQLLWRTLLSLQALTAYQNYEILVVDDGSHQQDVTNLCNAGKNGQRTRIVKCDTAASRWKAHNVGAAHANGDLLLFLDGGLEVIHTDWLEELVRWAELPGIGVVGARLLRLNGHIQHAGLVVGAKGVPVEHIFAGDSGHMFGMFGCVNWYRNYSAVTGAVHMIPRDAFRLVGGYDEDYQASFADVDICVRIGRSGRRVMYTPWARLLYHEAANPESPSSDEDLQRLHVVTSDIRDQGDPYFNRNLSFHDHYPWLEPVPEPIV